MEKTLPAAPRPPLLWLGAAVLLAHLLVLQRLSFPPGSDSAPLPRPLVLRTLPPTAETALERPAAKPKPRRQKAPPPLAPVAPPEEAAAITASPVSEPRPADPTAISEPPDVAASITAPAPDAAASEAEPATPLPPPATAVPGSIRLKYDIAGVVRQLNYSARGELLWRHDGASYEARLEVGAFLLGSRVQTSRGQLTPEGLAPKRFSDKVRSEVAAHFERDKGKVIFSANTPEVALQPGAQDHLSVFMQLASLLAGAPARYPAGSAIELQAVGARDAALWRFTVDGPETLQLPGGEQATLKLTRAPGQSFDLKVELWLAPALGMLPARIRLTQDNGDYIDQQWRASEAP
jgi:hypothetical protein